MVRRIAIWGVGVMVGWFVLHLIQRAILFPAGLLRSADHVAEREPSLERWWHRDGADRTEAWFIPGDDASPSNPAPAVIFAHGNGELIEFWLEPMERYRRLGISVLLVEYRGYGRSTGSPSEEVIASDFRAFYDRLVERPEVDPQRVIVHGRSLGGGAVCTLANARPVAAMILESTFTSIPDVVPWVPGFLFADHFNNAPVVRGFEGPMLIMHGNRDEVVPYSHGQRLAALAQDARFVTYACGHNDLPPSRQDYWRQIELLLRRADALR